MNEAQLYEKIGRLHAALDAERQAHDLTLKVFSEVVSGGCDASRIMVNLTDRSVTWAAPGERPATPSTINGVPVCVVAPEPQPDQEVGPFEDKATGHEVMVTGPRLVVLRMEKQSEPSPNGELAPLS